MEKQRCYAFDLDINLLNLDTKTLLKEKTSNEIIEVLGNELSKNGTVLKDNKEYIIYEDSFNNFRGRSIVKEIQERIDNPDLIGHCFDDFIESVRRGDKVAIITARGHSKEVVKQALTILLSNSKQFTQAEVQDFIQNKLEVYAVSGEEFEKKFGLPAVRPVMNIPERKQIAFSSFVKENKNKEYKNIFSFSDDQEKNVSAIKDTCRDLLNVLEEDIEFHLFHTTKEKIGFIREKTVLKKKSN